MGVLVRHAVINELMAQFLVISINILSIDEIDPLVILVRKWTVLIKL